MRPGRRAGPGRGPRPSTRQALAIAPGSRPHLDATARGTIPTGGVVLDRARIARPVRPSASQGGTDREFSANFDRQASATNSVSFLGLSPPKASKTVSFFVSFHRGVTQSGILFLVSIERGTSRRVYHRRPWLSDMSQLGGAPCRFLARLAVARVGVSDRSAQGLRQAERSPRRPVASAHRGDRSSVAAHRRAGGRAPARPPCGPRTRRWLLVE